MAVKDMTNRAYRIWWNMRQRCNNPNVPNYKNYGGRGIAVCERWQKSFDDFLADMGEPPSDRSLDRIDTNGNYEPSNCKWSTRYEQSRNSRRNRKVLFNGKLEHATELANAGGAKYATFQSRVRKGISEERAADPSPISNPAVGSRNFGAKLTEADVLEIRRRAAGGESTNSLASEFGVKAKHLRRIVARKFWRHI